MDTTHLLDALCAAIQIQYHTRELHSKAHFNVNLGLEHLWRHTSATVVLTLLYSRSSGRHGTLGDGEMQ